MFFIKQKAYKVEIGEFDQIAILISAYNEEDSIENTIQKLFRSNVDFSRLKIYIGNDGSSDKTSEILSTFQSNHPQLIVENFDRIGKGNVLNRLIEKYALNQKGIALIFLDANIELEADALFSIVRELQNNQTGIVGASVFPLHRNANTESSYILRENTIKVNESKAFDIAVGVFGACYGMRGDLYRSIPDNFITDDLYNTLSVIQQGYKIHYSESIQVYEDIQADVENEFKRKKRFAAGNFQILWFFKDLLNPFRTKIGHIYAYFFHKVIRWIAPVALLVTWIYSLLANDSLLFYVIRVAGFVIIVFLSINYLLYKSKKPIIAERLNYFLTMNLAIVFGFINFLKGIKSNVWERSERN